MHVLHLYGVRFCCLKVSTGASLVAQRVKHLPAMQETWVRSLGREDPLEKGTAPTPVFLPGESHGRRSLVGNAQRTAESHTRVSSFTSKVSIIFKSL